jgi:hypothetical protein
MRNGDNLVDSDVHHPRRGRACAHAGYFWPSSANEFSRRRNPPWFHVLLECAKTLCMSRPVVLLCLVLAACEPVLLGADEDEGIGGHQGQSMAIADAGSERSANDRDAETSDGAEPSTVSAATAPPIVATNEASPQVQLSVKSVDCGGCYDLVANGTGGAPPYRYEWDNGARSDTRRVCVSTSELSIWVAVEDSTGARSNAYVTHLRANDDAAACTSGSGASTSAVPMCFMNGSFEGTAAINTGGTFDAVPWSTCREAADNATNTPDIANATLDPAMSGFAPRPTAGTTYLAMTTGEQASQKLCQSLKAGDKTFLTLDARLIDLGGTDMFLRILGGSSADCSTPQLLWVSPALTSEWLSYCVPMQPGEFMDQITLRADQPVANLVLNVAAVDNLQPVDSCP